MNRMAWTWNGKRKVGTVLAAMLLSAALALSGCAKTEQASSGASAGTNNSTKASASATGEFKVAVIPAQNEGDMQKAMNKLSDDIGAALSRKVSVKVYPDYNGVVEAMNFGQVDMAFFGPLTYVLAHHDSGAEAIVVQLVDGKPDYHSIIIAPKDSPYNSLDDLLKDPSKIRFAFGDPNSTSGSLVPSMEMKKRGLYTDSTHSKFKEVRFTGAHDVTALAVQNKQVDAGAVDSAIFASLVKKGKIDASKVKQIWESEALFQYPWAVKKGTDAATVAKLQDMFVSLKDNDILQAFGISGFAKTSDQDYEAIRSAAEQDGRLKAAK